jgi:hypothetical protein
MDSHETDENDHCENGARDRVKSAERLDAMSYQNV